MEHAAFETIVRRHGPMVYRVCWRVLRREHETEDAFQATFLILARQIHTLRNQASLASWLHGIAHRVALKCRNQAAKRRACEKTIIRDQFSRDEIAWAETIALLDSELRRLPEKWRLPLVLCYLEAQTQEEAANQLGWSQRTLRRRLEEGREALKRRLAARGFVGPTTFSAALLSDCVAPASLAHDLVGSAVELATCQTARSVGRSLNAYALAEGVLWTMRLSKVIVIAVALTFLLGGGVIAGELLLRPQSVESPKRVRNVSGAIVQSKPAEPVIVRESAIFQEMAMRPDGAIVATVGIAREGSKSNATVKLWNTNTGKLRATLKEQKESYLHVAFSNEFLAIACNGRLDVERRSTEVSLLDAETLQPKYKVDQTLMPAIRHWGALAFSPDGKRLAMAGFADGPCIKLWDVEKQKLIGGKADQEVALHGLKAIQCLRFSPDGNLLAAGWGDGQIRLFDGRNSDFKRVLNPGMKVEFGLLGAGSIAISPDSQWLASPGHEGTLVLWNLLDETKNRTLKCQPGRVMATAFSGDGKRFATGGTTVHSGGIATRGKMSEATLWDFDTGEQIRKFNGLTEMIHVIAFSPDSKTVAMCGGAGSTSASDMKTFETSGEVAFIYLK